MKKRTQIRIFTITGWFSIILGIILFIFLLPANKFFFGAFLLADTISKELLHICLVFIGVLLLYIRDLEKKLLDAEANETKQE